MPDFKTMDEYLVELGWNVDYISQRKMHEALSRTQEVVGKFTRSATEGFLGLGAAFVSATTAVAGSTLGLMHSVAQQDLGFQIYARRMMMGEDAARKMKTATDALGMSLEEIIWGPPELQERYQQLIKDQTRMLELLGGDRGESAFRKIRDIEFQFTRMGPALQMFGFRLTEDIINKLAGGPDSLENRMKHFVDWFESPDGFPKIADELSNRIVPFLKGVGDLAERLFTRKNLDWTINVAGKGVDFLTSVIAWSSNNPGWAEAIFGAVLGANAGKMFGPTGAGVGAILGALPGLTRQSADYERKFTTEQWQSASAQGQMKLWALQAAARHHIDPFMLMGVFSTESGTKFGWNPNARNPKSGAMGIGQFMPDTAKQFGINPYDPEQSIEATASYLESLTKQYGESGALKRYGGFVTKDSSGYESEVRRRANLYRGGSGSTNALPSLQPQSFHMDGDVHVYLQGTSFTEDQARRIVGEEVHKAHKKMALDLLARAQGAYV